MEINKIKCLLSTKDIDRLKEFKHHDISVFSEVSDGKTVIVKLHGYDIVYFVTNEPTEQIDFDEYPVLRINSSFDYSFKKNFELKNVKLLSMCLIRDKICWVRDGVKWEVEIDIGMKIVTDKKEISFIAIDSVGGLMVFAFGDSIKVPDSENDLKDQWIYKANEFISLCREQVLIL